MSQENETDDAGEMAKLRDEYPSGWRVLTQHDTVSDIMDALMDAPDYHFSKSKLGEKPVSSLLTIFGGIQRLSSH